MKRQWHKEYKHIRRQINHLMTTYRKMYDDYEPFDDMYAMWQQIERLIHQLPANDTGRAVQKEAFELMQYRAAQQERDDLLREYWGSV